MPGFLFDMLSMCVCTTRHEQASGQLAQDLHVCTVDENAFALGN